MSKLANRLAAAALIAFGLAGLASAQTDASSTTRAAVMAELQAARASGYMTAMHGEDSGASWLNQQRAAGGQVQSAAVSAAGGALAAALIGEDSGSFYLSANAHDSTPRRASVVAGASAGR